METKTLAGFLLINKPKGISSFACIKQMQQVIGRKYGIGHTGTLDPFATGLLIIAFDRSATKHIDKFLTLDKTYIARGKLGELTDTLDCTGQVIATCKTEGITVTHISNAIEELDDEYEQTPPIYAALKHEGIPLYQLARDQELSVEQLTAIAQKKKRLVQLYSLKIDGWEFPFFTIVAHVSCGTYIRSLVNDIAELAGSCATTYELDRTDIGPFSVENAINLADLRTINDIEKHLISIDDMLEYL